MQTLSSSLPQEVRTLYSYVKSLSPTAPNQILGEQCADSENTSTDQTWPLGDPFETPGVCELGWEQENCSLEEWEVGSFQAEVGLKGSEHGWGGRLW